MNADRKETEMDDDEKTSRSFRDAVLAHARAKEKTVGAQNYLDAAKEEERLARLAESKAKRELLAEARGIVTIPRKKQASA